MKNIVLIIFLMLQNSSFSQLLIDAGNDTVFCFTNNVTYSIGANPTASNGSTPYTYKWSIKNPYTIPFSNITLHASDFLSDTTISNPNIIDGFGILDSIYFFLEVEDNSGTIKKDSILVYFSIFSIGTMYRTYDILNGDSLFIDYGPGVGGGLGNLSYLWRPNHGLIDSTNYTFWTIPDHTIDYYCIVKDTNNCTITTPIIYHINVHFLNIEELLTLKSNSIILYPNPTSGEIYFKTNSLNIQNIFIYDESLKLIDTISSEINTYDLRNYPKGIYIIKFEFKNKIISKKIILQ